MVPFFIILFMAMKYMGAKMIAYILNVTKFGYKSLKKSKVMSRHNIPPPYLSCALFPFLMFPFFI